VLGAFRAVAQLVSYEVPFILATLIPILLARSMSTVAIVESQTVPFLFVVPLAAVIFFISSLAETGTTPFDLLEAESEIVAGFHIEYSGMKFAMFYLAEFLGALFMSALFATVFLGGWNIPLINLMLSLFGVQSIDLSAMGIAGSILGLIVFLIKTFFIYFIFLWIRATWPRVRVDQILSLNWKILVPISLVLILVVAVLDKMIPEGTNDLVRAGILLASNVLIAFVALEIMRRNGRQRRELIVDSGLVESGKQEVVEAAPLH
jgi:NADH-quinone oxidoreductase subunit H